MSPWVSRFWAVMSISSMMATASWRREGFGMMKTASCICRAKSVFSPLWSDLMKGKTTSRTCSSICSAG